MPWRIFVLLAAVLGLTGAPAVPLSAQTLVLQDTLLGSTSGTRAGGAFVTGGWKAVSQYDSIYWHIPTLAHGAVEWDISGLFPGESRAGMEDKSELFHMYDYTYNNSDFNYNPGYRDNPFKQFVRKIGALNGPTTDAMELVYKIGETYVEPDTAVLSWNPATTYHFRQEWGPGIGGGTRFELYRDGVPLRTETLPGSYAPPGHSLRIGASTRRAPDAGASIDAIFSNLKVWDLSLSDPPPPLPAPRTGVVHLDGHALQDDQGPFLGLGASYFQALRRTKFDRARLRSDLDFLARRGFNYIRVLSMVGWNEAWAGKEIAPVAFQNRAGQSVQAWPDYWQQFRDMVDIAYDEFGLRTEITVFADAQLMPDKAARVQHMQTMLDNLQGRESKVMMLEVANESWQNGFAGAQGVADVREFGQYLGQRTALPIALSSPDDTSNAGIEQMYQGSAADIATVHFSRDRGTVEGGWLPVRDTWRVNALNGVPPVSSNEPIGPGASVTSETDPIKLVSAAAYAWMSGLPMYVYHTDAGVFGATRFEDKPAANDYRHLASILPGDIGNWPQVTEGDAPFAPFITYCNGQANVPWTAVPGATNGALRHLSRVRDREFYTLPIGILSDGVELEPRQNMTLQAFNPLTGEVLYEATPSAGQRFTLAQGPQAYIIRGTTAGTGPATIDLDAINRPDGLLHPQGGDGDTTAATVAGRAARRNSDPAEDFYMYFAVADWFAYRANQQDLYITIDYLNQGAGALVLQYDSNTGSTLPAFYKNGGSVSLTNSGDWRRQTFHVTDAYFGNRQNQAADFRFSGGVGATFYVDRVEVSQTRPLVGGDANMDWRVDISDLGILAGHWQTSGGWTDGDFDDSGFVDISDLGILATNWQFGLGSPPLGPRFNEALAAIGLGSAGVPEPTIATTVLGLVVLLSRCR